MSVPDTMQLIDWVLAIQMNGTNLTVWEEGFVGDMVTKVERWGDKVKFTDAQAEQIERIYAERTV